MTSAAPRLLPPDQPMREQALDASQSILVQAPAGSGKTDLLTRRFLLLLAQVDEPSQILAITFTNAAAAEMRHRILSELEKALTREAAGPDTDIDEFSIESLASRALARSQALGWNLIELPAQLRISTIDAFCRELALRQPLLSGLGSSLEIFDDPEQLYRRAAQRTLEQIDTADSELRGAIESLLLWRDNGWQEMEDLLAAMLAQRDKWMHGFVFAPEQNWDALRVRLERSFARAVREPLHHLSAMLDLVPHARSEALELARFACAQTAGALHRELAEIAEFPIPPFAAAAQLEEAQQACTCLAGLLLTATEGTFRKQINVNLGFPREAKKEKERLAALIQDLRAVPGLASGLAAVGSLPPLRYSEDDWQIVRASFALLRRAAAELKVVFAEAGAVDYTEIAQIAQSVLRSDDGIPTEGALAVADNICHLLVDEFQDTSRKQHQLLTRLIAAWPEREGRTCFVVGDPMQSIYSFRDADVELFSRVRDNGLEIPQDLPLQFNPVRLTANFRSAAPLVARINDIFEQVFSEDDGSGVAFTRAEAARQAETGLYLTREQVRKDEPRLSLHAHFMAAAQRDGDSAAADEIKREALDAETAGIVSLIRSHQERMDRARSEGRSYRIAVLGRARTALVPVAEALHAAQISFRAVEVEKLKDRPEILDALALLRALLNPLDRVAWLGVLRAPWCGLSLAELHTLVSADDPVLMARAVPDLIAERESLLAFSSRLSISRVMQAAEVASARRAAYPAQALGTWLEQTWLRVGGEDCVDRTARANLDLLWSCLDGLPDGERDALGSALDAALDKLTASPDPASDGECGVQLMTIHKAKGLEFEVVIVPELQVRGGRTRGGLLSWLERGILERGHAEPDESGELTEFLIAPIASKGADSGQTRKWVDRVRCERERQETRRVLYVAATRAREELHLFARLTYKTESNGSMTLVEPKDCLLSTAWPAFAREAQLQFEAWQAVQVPGSLDSIAAAGADNRLEMPPAIRPTVLRRLPAGYQPAVQGTETESTSPATISGAGQLYERHEGGVHSRALGTAVHALLQELARLRQSLDWQASRAAITKMESRAASEIRAHGIERAQSLHMTAQAVELALTASRDPLAQWILSPRAESASEARWVGVVAGGLRTVQIDRVFKAGAELFSQAGETWWLIDYKTAVADNLDSDSALVVLRQAFAPQVEAYARILRNLHGGDAKIHGALYYPRMMKFDWWTI